MSQMLSKIMQESGVKFGTSGARGLVTALTDRVCYCYAAAFARYLLDTAQRKAGEPVAVAGDLRPSSPRIMAACAKALTDSGLLVDYQGFVPSPAIAYYGLVKKMPTIMVTGSHIPADRNGIKFTTARGEITKDEERDLAATAIEIPEMLFNTDGSFKSSAILPAENTEAKSLYIDRYTSFFPKDLLSGLKVGFYQHSAVGRDIIVEILRSLGADVIPGGRSETFIPVDTEALNPPDVEFAQKFSAQKQCDAIVTTDGDSDRPLVADENGHWLKGDVAGIITATYLEAQNVVVPVSVSSAVDQVTNFSRVARCRIGSPFVIHELEQLTSSGRTIGFEANGGFLLASDIDSNGRCLAALPTRDAALVHICTLAAAKKMDLKVSALVKKVVPTWFTQAGRIQCFPLELSHARLADLASGTYQEAAERISQIFGHICGELADFNTVDGVRCTFKNKEVIHLRASGNAPEFRVYTEASSPERAQEIVDRAIKIPQEWLKAGQK